VCERAGGEWTPYRGTAIGNVNSSGELVAGVLYEDYNGANVICHIAGDPGWASRRYLSVIFDYPFNQMKVKRITAPISSVNKKSINLVKKMGFVLESTLSQATPEGDLHLFRLFKEECKYIKGKYEIKSASCT
jgi:RimJ/RimL family protein N-acetyltransferase